MAVIGNQIEKGADLDGKSPWIKGKVSIGNREIYVDTKTGEGIAEILDVLKKFVTYQSAKIKFPAMSQEDIMQDLYVLALEAIPKYTDNKNANMLTFLQGHIKNRLINKCKFVSEKKRRATYFNLSMYKVRCPNCRRFILSDGERLPECVKCGDDAGILGKKWKKYNIPIVPLSFSALEGGLTSEEGNIADLMPSSFTFATLAGKHHYAIDEEIQFRLDFKKFYDSLDDMDKSIISLLLEGYAYRDIANKIGIAEKATYARVANILKASKS